MTVETTAVLVDATLPRLSINLRTATYRQILRLQASLADGGDTATIRRAQASASNDTSAGGRAGGRGDGQGGGGGAIRSPPGDGVGDGPDGAMDEEAAELAAAEAAADDQAAALSVEDGGGVSDGLVKNRVMQCSFTAPHISLEIRYDRDAGDDGTSPVNSRSGSAATASGPTDLFTDGGGTRAYAAARPLLRASVEGIAGTLTKSDPLSEGAAEAVVEATVALRRMEVWDDYQTAGPDFAALVSSGGGAGDGSPGTASPFSHNLVKIDYVSKSSLSEMAIRCDSLLFQWNPETIIAFKKWLASPPSNTQQPAKTSSSGSVSSLGRGHASQGSLQSDESFEGDVEEAFLRHWNDARAEEKANTPDDSGGGGSGSGGGGGGKPAATKEMLMTFYLKSVAVSFNKEVSGVKLAVARMDNAMVRYHRAASGGEREGGGEHGEAVGAAGTARHDASVDVVALAPGEVMKMSGTIGNLSLMDASTPGTLYPEIIGLQRQPRGSLNGGGEAGEVGEEGAGTLLLTAEAPYDDEGQSVVEFSYTSFDHQSLSELEYGSALDCRFR